MRSNLVGQIIEIISISKKKRNNKNKTIIYYLILGRLVSILPRLRGLIPFYEYFILRAIARRISTSNEIQSKVLRYPRKGSLRSLG